MTRSDWLLFFAIWIAVAIPVAVAVGRLLAHRAEDYPLAGRDQ